MEEVTRRGAVIRIKMSMYKKKHPVDFIRKEYDRMSSYSLVLFSFRFVVKNGNLHKRKYPGFSRWVPSNHREP